MTKHRAANGVFTITGALATTRSSHTATVLADGKVLVVGGTDKNHLGLDRAELYDRKTGTWNPTGSLRVARVAHTATLLASGKVLVSGGRFGPDSINTAELYDPATGEWSTTGSLKVARSSHTATLLPGGLVLVAGGVGTQDFPDRVNTAELYDPAIGKWRATGSLTLDNGRESHTATLLEDGTVLIVGGITFGPFMAEGAELYDPKRGRWKATGAPGQVRAGHTTTLLRNGKVLVVGGVSSNGPSAELDSAEIYDPVTRIFAATGTLNTACNRHTATLLRDGRVLLIGGFKDVTRGGIRRGSTLTRAELYDPRQAIWSVTADLNEARGEHAAALLAQGTVLVAGGSKSRRNQFVALKRAELFRSETK